MKKIGRFAAFALVLIVGCAAFANGAEGGAVSYPNFGLPRVEAMMFLALQIGIILIAARIGGSVAARLRLPSILGELAAGIVIGPWALGGIGFGEGLFKYGIFHGAALREMANVAAPQAMFGTLAAPGVQFDATTPELYGIATLASVILLFLSGLETNIKMFLKYSVVGFLVGVGGVVFSFVLGDWCAVYFLPKFFAGVGWIDELAGMEFMQAAMQPGPMFMGIMSTATSVGITARILSERKKMDTEEGVSIMAGAVIDDVLGLIVLAIGMGIIKANSAGTALDGGKILGVAGNAFGIWIGSMVVGLASARVLAWIFRRLFDSREVGKTHQDMMGVMAFALALVLAAFFESKGLAMIIGAYVMGLTFSCTELKHVIESSLAPVYAFLVPVFFCAMGMMVDVEALCSAPVVYFGLIYTAIAVIAKVAGCALPSLACGFNTIGAVRIGAGMVPRGEVALIIAGIGLSQGFLTQEVFGIGILMTLLTTVVAPPALVGLFAVEKKGVRKQKESMDGSRQVAFDFSSPTTASIALGRLVEQFEKEGYYVHAYKSGEGTIWQINGRMKGSFEISIVLEGGKILIECTPKEEGVVRQALREVAAAINDILSEVKNYMEKETPENVEVDDDETTAKGVAGIIASFAMVPAFKAGSKKEAFEKLTKVIAEANGKKVLDAGALLPAVVKREESMSTGLNHGLALPHGRTDAVSEIVGAVAIVDNTGSDGGAIADYETLDHSMVQVIVLTVAPETSKSPYLQVIAFISKTLRGEGGLERLVACKTAEEMRMFFKKAK